MHPGSKTERAMGMVCAFFRMDCPEIAVLYILQNIDGFT